MAILNNNDVCLNVLLQFKYIYLSYEFMFLY
jgi:hypothetical protein